MCVRWFLNSCLSFFCISPKQIETKSSNISQQAQFLEFGTMRIESLSICSSNLLIKLSSCKSYVHRFLLYFDFNTICWENCLRRQLFITGWLAGWLAGLLAGWPAFWNVVQHKALVHQGCNFCLDYFVLLRWDMLLCVTSMCHSESASWPVQK